MTAMQTKGRQEQIGALQQEVDSIHHANSLYWQQTLYCDSGESKAEFYQRKGRLVEIMSELSRLRKSSY
jgi:hypothetical protein